MTTIGIYDSGIGGLTTLNVLSNAYKNANFFYYADNASMPFGTKTKEEIAEIVEKALKILRENSDVQVLACNTASVSSTADNVIRLMPDLKKCSMPKTITLATPLTLSLLTEKQINENFCPFLCADTTYLAKLVEHLAEYAYISKQDLSFTPIQGYIKKSLENFKNIETVIIGCSHYVYVEKEIKNIFNNKNFDDGNNRVLKQLKNLNLQDVGTHKLAFEFSGKNEEKKYRYILKKLQKPAFFRG